MPGFKPCRMAVKRLAAVAVCATAARTLPSTAFGHESRFNKKVDASIRKGIGNLLDTERHGQWKDNIFTANAYPPPGQFDQNNGETALVVDALLNASLSTNDARLSLTSSAMRSAVRALLNFVPDTTYAAGFQASALALLPSSRQTFMALQRDRIFLTESLHSNGAYGYGWMAKERKNPNEPDNWDGSNTQYGALGLWAIADTRKIMINRRYWKLLGQHYRHTQRSSGAWWYHNGPAFGPYPALERHAVTMSAAGVATLYIVDQFLDRQVRLNPVQDPNIRNGLAYVESNFNNALGNGYALYGDERVGLASGLKFFGATNWFKVGAKQLMSTQAANGSFGDPFVNSTKRITTAYALLFLSRGGVPVLFNKLQYAGPWDARPRDDANVTEWIGKRYQAALKWQVVNFKVPTKEWLDAPILLITGHVGDGFHGFSTAEIKKFRHYVNAGGLIVSTCDGSPFAFTKEMTAAAESMVHHKYKMLPLPPDSPVYKVQTGVAFSPLPKLEGLSNGVRLLWVNASMDLGATWQRDAFANEVPWNLAANLVFYANGKRSLSHRFPDLNVAPPKVSGGTSVHLALVKYKGNWNPEPDAWPRMTQIAAARYRMVLTTAPEPVASLNAAATPVAHMTGTAAFKLGSAQRAALKQYLASGGLLFADAAGGSPAFARSFESLMKQLYPNASLRRLKQRSAIYAAHAPGSVAIKKARFRRFFIRKHGLTRKPRLLGLKIKGRYVILFSKEDICSAFLGTHTWGIVGYNKKTAYPLAADILLFGATRKH